MHRLPNQNTVRRFRIVALLILLKWVLITVSVPWFCYTMMVERVDSGYYAIGGLVLAGLLSLGHWALGMRARCPLCFVPSFSHQQQAKSRRALHLLGSYRLFVALGVIFRGWFHCPYCGEETAVEVRQQRHK